MEATGSVVRPPSRLLVAIGGGIFGIALAAGLAAWGVFGDDPHDAWEYLAVLGMIAAGALIVFGWIVPRGLRKESAGATAIALSALGVLTIAVFWSGLPPVLAAGGLVLGVAGWSARTGAWLCRAATVVGAFAIVGDIVIYIGDMT